jgi:hypothetical protein
VAEPALLGQYLDGAISPEVMVENLDVILARLMAEGFGAAEAQAAYQAVTSCALGSAVNAIREKRAVDTGRPDAKAFAAVVAHRPDDELPHLRALLAEISVRPLDTFEARITTVLAGIAARRGDDWQDVTARIDRLLTAHG